MIRDDDCLRAPFASADLWCYVNVLLLFITIINVVLVVVLV